MLLPEVSFLTGLHGSIATALICVLLYVDEAGVPLPLCPNEVLLIVAGLLIASGAVPVVIFFPIAVLAMALGTLTGYSWARRVGSDQLQTIAEKVHVGPAMERVTERMRQANARKIFVLRLIPGVRPYATLVAGAAGVPLGLFMRASVLAIVIWSAVITALGYFVGLPATLLLQQFENLALSGGLLVALGIIGYRAATRASDPRHSLMALDTFKGIAHRDRLWIAALVDFGVIATIAAGIDRLTRAVGIRIQTPFSPANGGWLDVLTVAAATALGYLVLSRRVSKGETAGERLFDVTYIRNRRRKNTPVSNDRRKSRRRAP
jgi:membrane protein DedA with SNARE-associated domain